MAICSWRICLTTWLLSSLVGIWITSIFAIGLDQTLLLHFQVLQGKQSITPVQWPMFHHIYFRQRVQDHDGHSKTMVSRVNLFFQFCFHVTPMQQIWWLQIAFLGSFFHAVSPECGFSTPIPFCIVLLLSVWPMATNNVQCLVSWTRFCAQFRERGSRFSPYPRFMIC